MAICKTVSVNGFTMPVASFGRGGNALVIIPGVSVENTTQYADAVEAAYASLKEDYTVYLIDRRQEVPMGYSLADMARDTLTVLDALNITFFSVMGASQGGMIGLYLASMEPKRVKKMLLVSTAWRLGSMAEKRFRSWADLSAANDVQALAKAFVENVYSPKLLNVQREALLEQNLHYAKEQLARFSILCEAFFTADLEYRLKDIVCPCFVVGSEGDRVYGIDAIRDLAERLGCQRYFYDNTTGHALYDEEASFYTEHLFPFFLE